MRASSAKYLVTQAAPSLSDVPPGPYLEVKVEARWRRKVGSQIREVVLATSRLPNLKEEHEKAADEEEESRRQLQLADGGWMWSQRDRKSEEKENKPVKTGACLLLMTEL
ncbi:unnamed protein product [Pleuronectes platessa]|uniref:Uncharacterized protein n=1 Tax=Pleuronectes platessa TaxID=8262 RepID=A0A9N7UB57_PLEPL|nr:unnamed protein product [Pleuronectes platessa]